jgi:hypothetical protein
MTQPEIRDDYAAILQSTHDGDQRFIPVLAEKVDLPPYARIRQPPDLTDKRHHDANLDTLAKTIRNALNSTEATNAIGERAGRKPTSIATPNPNNYLVPRTISLMPTPGNAVRRAIPRRTVIGMTMCYADGASARAVLSVAADPTTPLPADGFLVVTGMSAVKRRTPSVVVRELRTASMSAEDRQQAVTALVAMIDEGWSDDQGPQRLALLVDRISVAALRRLSGCW